MGKVTRPSYRSRTRNHGNIFPPSKRSAALLLTMGLFVVACTGSTRGVVIPADFEEEVTASRSVATSGTPLPDIANAVLADDGGPPLPLGAVNTLPNEDRLNFLFEFCFDGCWRDAHFMDPENPDVGSGPWPTDRPFHVRHGFVNEGSEPLGAGFDVALYVFSIDESFEETEPDAIDESFEETEPGRSTEDGAVAATQTSRYTSDFVLRGEAEHCGPTYKSQTGPVTCEWFVHDFPEGLPQGRWAIWAVWEAPCSAWVDYGLTESCANPNEIVSFFSSGVDSPFGSGPPSYNEPNMATVDLEDQTEEPSEGTFGEEAPAPQPRPDLSLVPDRTAPGALGRVELPAEPEEIQAVLASMPESLAGEQRVETPQLPEPASRYDLGYGQVVLEGISMGPKLHLTVIDVQSGDFFPTNFTGPDVIAFRFAFQEDPHEEDDAFSYEAGRDGEVFWMSEESFMGHGGTSETQATFSLMWARADSKWLFGAVADTPEHLDLLVAAFIDAAEVAG